MQMNLSDYVKVYPMMNKDLCESSIDQLENVEQWKQHQFYDPKQTNSLTLSGDQELDVSWEDMPNKEILMQVIWRSLQKYVIQDLNFTYFNGWTGYSHLRFNRYKETRKMANHCDHIHSLFDGTHKGIPIISVIGVLNDNYKGGEFIMFDNMKIELKQGDVMLFPSNFLYPHRVEPVTEGTRYSFVSWAW